MKEKKRKNTSKNIDQLDIDRDFSKYYWIIIPVLTVIYFSYSFFSNGFYQDDEVAHFINMRDFWSDPWIIMSNWGKPGWKIFLVLPSLLGYEPILFINSVITALTAYFTVLLCKEMKLKNSLLAGILFAFQPLVLQLSFRSYAEIFTGLLLVLCLFFYFKQNYITSAVICGLSFTVRQESALLCIILAVFLVKEKKYLPVLFLGLFPLLLNLLGFLHTGDPLWAWSEMKNLSEFNLGIKRGFFHYFEVYIFIAGPVVFSLFILGILKPFFIKGDRTDFYRKDLIVYLFFFTVFLFQCYLVIKGTNPGSWRYILQISPFAAVISLAGFNELLLLREKKYVLPALFSTLILTFLLFSKAATGLVITDEPEFGKFAVIAILTGLAIVMVRYSNKVLFRQFVIIVILLTVGFTFITEKPKQKSPENVTVGRIADWYSLNAKKEAPVLYNHSLILFYGNIFGKDKEKFKILNLKTLEESPSGSIIIWDSHYSYRPEYKNDTQIENLMNNKAYKLQSQFTSDDRRFTAYIFEKL